MKLGLLLTATHDASTPPAIQIDEHRRLVRMAHELGFDLMVAGQHFLSSSLRYYQPVPYLAHLAALAPGMRTATGILLLPLLQPIEVAEDLATLDALTDGRAVMGVGIGYADLEFDAFGVDRRTRVRRFEESLDVIRAMWSGKDVCHHGEFWSFEAPAGAVLPVQPGGPPIWVAGQTEAAVRRAARTGDAWYVPPFPTHQELAALREVFLDERERADLPLDGEFPVRRELFIAPSARAAVDVIGDQVRDRFETYLQWGMREDADVRPGFAEAAEAELAQRFILGPPEHCAEVLTGLEAELGMTTFVLKVQWPGLEARVAFEQLEQFGDHVLPLIDVERS